MPGSDAYSQALHEHLSAGVTTVCRCWLVQRSDGWTRGFTDHDEDVAFEGDVFRASSGLTASALDATTGLSVDNSEVVGALNDAGISEEDIETGRFDNASILSWLVNWAEPDQRVIQFRGTIGEVTRSGDAFGAELRGMTDALNVPRGRVFQRDCSAILGDSQCGFDAGREGYHVELAVVDAEDARVLRVSNPDGVEPKWFERGRLEVVDGAGAGLFGWIKNDLVDGGLREITLWQGLRTDLRAGDRIRLTAGCDKRASTCAKKFANFHNFRGCPHIPGEDWLTAYPRRGGGNDGASMNAPIRS